MTRLLADLSLPRRALKGCLQREPSMDFLSAQSARLDGLPDPEVLAPAASEGRVLVSSDIRTMPVHLSEYLQRHGTHPGVLLAKQHWPLAPVIEALILVWAASKLSKWQNRCLELAYE